MNKCLIPLPSVSCCNIGLVFVLNKFVDERKGREEEVDWGKEEMEGIRGQGLSEEERKLGKEA